MARLLLCWASGLVLEPRKTAIARSPAPHGHGNNPGPSWTSPCGAVVFFFFSLSATDIKKSLSLGALAHAQKNGEILSKRTHGSLVRGGRSGGLCDRAGIPSFAYSTAKRMFALTREKKQQKRSAKTPPQKAQKHQKRRKKHQKKTRLRAKLGLSRQLKKKSPFHPRWNETKKIPLCFAI